MCYFHFETALKLAEFKTDILSEVKSVLSAIVPEKQCHTEQAPEILPLVTPTYSTIASKTKQFPSTNVLNCANTQVFISNNTVLNTPVIDNEDVVILSKDEESNSASVDSVKKAVSDKFKKIPFDFANSKSKSSKIAIRFHSKESRNAGINLLTNDQSFLNPLGYKCEEATKMLPKLTLSGVPKYILNDIDRESLTNDEIRDAEKKAIVTEILDKNHCIENLISSGHTLQVVYLTRTLEAKSGNLTVGLKVSPLIRSTILAEQSGYFFIGGKRLLFRDRFHVKQCYHCQLLGHISTDCPEKQNNPICLYCMGDHRSSLCTFKQTLDRHCCAKCHTSKNPDYAAHYNNHNSASLDCPLLVKECKRLASITDFTSKNVK